MNRYRIVLAAALVLLPARAWSLEPQEVLVVANSAVEKSVELANLYLQQRGIDQSNLVLLKTTGEYEVSRENFDNQIRLPLRRAIEDRGLKDKIRCICLIWGIPVRVAGPVPTAEQRAVLDVYQRAATRCHNRLAIDLELAGLVGTRFPPPDASALKPLGKLFDKALPEPPRSLPAPSELVERLKAVLAEKQTQVAQIKDPAKRRGAYLQLMGLQLDAFGLRGLGEYVSDAKPPDAPAVEDIEKQLAEARRRIQQVQRNAQTPDNAQALLDLTDAAEGAIASLILARTREQQIKPPDADASVDSELALLWVDGYDLARMLPNPYFWRSPGGPDAPKIVLTARIDGPDPADAEQIIKSSLATEQAGLEGTFYIDAGAQGVANAAAYDLHFKKLYAFVVSYTKLKAVLDEKEAVLPQGSAPNAALYVGWYSLRNYVSAFEWVPGAVGWHVASWEAQHLREPNSKEWCVKMIQNGVAATLGAVNEPYLQAFPLPEDFFALVLTGKYTVAECYWRTSPTVSWRMTLIADPLYKPFAANAQVDADVLPKELLP